MASFNIMGGGLKFPETEFLTNLQSGANTISCDVGDIVFIDRWLTQSTNTTITSGGTLIGRINTIIVIKATSTSLKVNIGGSGAFIWGVKIKNPKTNYTTISEIANNTKYTNLTKNSIIYTRGGGQSNMSVGIVEITNVVFYAAGNVLGQGNNESSVMAYVTDSTNTIRVTDAYMVGACLS